LDKNFQNFRLSIRGFAKYCFAHFAHFAFFFSKTTTFQSKNVIFIILIFNELSLFYPWFSRNDYVCLQVKNPQTSK